MSVEKYLAGSAKVEIDDLDWAAAREAGLTENERFILTYFADIEGQTIVYLRDFLQTKAALEPDVIAFLSMWNYEEYFHGAAIARLMAECGHPLDDARIATVRKHVTVRERFEAVLASGLSKVFHKDFPALYMAWGAMQELTTLRGYERIMQTSQNPVLVELCRRIAKQERRHFAWYFNSARERLLGSRRAQKLTRTLMRLAWTPVGAGVKEKEDVFRMMRLLFPLESKMEIARAIDEKVDTLPGLEGMGLMVRYMSKVPMDPQVEGEGLPLAVADAA